MANRSDTLADEIQLRALEAQRKQATLNGRDELHSLLGDGKFLELDSFIKMRIGLEVKKGSLPLPR
jgi:hypothetical protein